MTAETLEQKILIACSGSLGTAICHVQPPDLVRGKKAVFLDSLQNGVVLPPYPICRTEKQSV